MGIGETRLTVGDDDYIDSYFPLAQHLLAWGAAEAFRCKKIGYILVYNFRTVLMVTELSVNSNFLDEPANSATLEYFIASSRVCKIFLQAGFRRVVLLLGFLWITVLVKVWEDCAVAHPAE